MNDFVPMNTNLPFPLCHARLNPTWMSSIGHANILESFLTSNLSISSRPITSIITTAHRNTNPSQPQYIQCPCILQVEDFYDISTSLFQQASGDAQDEGIGRQNTNRNTSNGHTNRVIVDTDGDEGDEMSDNGNRYTGINGRVVKIMLSDGHSAYWALDCGDVGVAWSVGMKVLLKASNKEHGAVEMWEGMMMLQAGNVQVLSSVGVRNGSVGGPSLLSASERLSRMKEVISNE